MAEDITTLLCRFSDGDPEAQERLIESIYPVLKRLAGRRLVTPGDRGRFQTTELVHETFLQLIDQRRVRWQDRAHFFAIVARLMRRVLLDAARSQNREKRGGGEIPESLGEVFVAVEGIDEGAMAVTQAVERLRAIDARAAEIVELRYIGGLSVDETAEALNLGRTTVTRSWRFARSWMRLQLSTPPESGGGPSPGPGVLEERA
ncbi:MAG: ECF-type sigma factor [Acidobacteriota bacterium]